MTPEKSLLTPEDLLRIPPYYSSRILPALTYRDPGVVRELIADLTSFRDDYSSAASHHRTLIEQFKGKRREELIESLRSAASSCDETVRASNEVLGALQATKSGHNPRPETGARSVSNAIDEFVNDSPSPSAI
jgi:hypothetical protein